MTSVADVVAALDGALSKAREAVERLHSAGQAWREYNAQLAGLLAGSRHDGVQDLVRFAAAVARSCEDALAATLAGIAVVEAYRERVAGVPVASLTTSTAAPKVISPAGDSYPPDAAWAAHLIDQPHSANNSGVPVVGIARATGSVATFEFRPGVGKWTEVAHARLVGLKAREWVFTTVVHVEMQVAAWMVETGTRHVELVINRVPCGEPVGQGCHQVLPGFLPVGYRLVVSGTRGGNRYYSYDYDGKARS